MTNGTQRVSDAEIAEWINNEGDRTRMRRPAWREP